jgi:hypothetical protein
MKRILLLILLLVSLNGISQSFTLSGKLQYKDAIKVIIWKGDSTKQLWELHEVYSFKNNYKIKLSKKNIYRIEFYSNTNISEVFVYNEKDGKFNLNLNFDDNKSYYVISSLLDKSYFLKEL